MIPHDEPHRFLNWQADRDGCIPWGQHFENGGVPYAIVEVLGLGWTIYKHQYEMSERTRPKGTWCCGATA